MDTGVDAGVAGVVATPAVGALVTGASGGIGAATVRRLSEAGYRVCVTDLDLGSCEALAAEVGNGAWARRLDVTDFDECERSAREVVDTTGRLGLWVNNAGVIFQGLAQDQGPDLHSKMIAVNAMGTVNGTLAALGPMREAGGGHVINVVSLAGLIAVPGEAGYAASKHAALAFSLGLLYDIKRSGEQQIDVSVICPDGVWTPMISVMLDDPEGAASFSGSTLMPEDVAERIAAVARKPRAVTSIPRWRGGFVRLLDLFPGLAVRLMPLILADAQRKQRRFAKRVRAGKIPLPDRPGNQDSP